MKPKHRPPLGPARTVVHLPASRTASGGSVQMGAGGEGDQTMRRGGGKVGELVRKGLRGGGFEEWRSVR